MDSLLLKRKKLYYQSCHRGCKETDYLLEKAALSLLDYFDETELALYEQFICEDDWNIYAWLTGKYDLPTHLQNEVTAKILSAVTR